MRDHVLIEAIQPFQGRLIRIEEHALIIPGPVVTIILQQFQAKFFQDAAGFGDDPGAVFQALVPGRRESEKAAGVAGAEGADDDVVDAVGVFHGDEVGGLDVDAQVGDYPLQALVLLRNY